MVLVEIIRRYIVVEISFFWIAIGLAALGYFIGDGLKILVNLKKNQVILI